MREMERFERWARDLEAELASGQRAGGKVRMSWSDSCKGFAPSKRWGFHSARFQHTGRDGGREDDSSAPEPRRDNTVNPRDRDSSALQQEKVWSPSPPEPGDYYIDPVTNKKVAKSGKAKSDVVHKTDEPIELGPPVTNQKVATSGAGAEAKDGVINKTDEPIELGPPATHEVSESGTDSQTRDDVVHKTSDPIELGPPAADSKGAVKPEAEKHAGAAKPVNHQPPGRRYPCAPDQYERETSVQQNQGAPPVGPTKKKKKGMKSIESSKPQARTSQSNGVAQNQGGPHPNGTRNWTGRGIMPPHIYHVSNFCENISPAWAGLHRSGAVGEDGSSAGSIAEKRGGLYPTGTQSERPRMTGNYVQDFPEDFAETWAGRYRSEECIDKEESPERLEPALNRTTAQASGDRPTPQTELDEPRTSHDELVEELRDIYEQSYGTIDEQPVLSSSLATQSPGKATPIKEIERAPRDPDPEPEPQQTFYKVLVYDPQEQKISTADATSTAPDDIDVLTPAEAVTQLSNPAKFLPHFGPLQARGYEIVSSENNVLVFRKTREATEPGTVFLRGAAYPSPPGPRRATSAPAVNPIDMMGSEPVVPNIGNFASPTGYANYGELEEPSVPKRKPPPPFRAASEVDYEDGAESSRGKGREGPGVLWRTTVGAVWMAGLVYGGSVINEYFRTGGEGGEGPRGVF